MPEQRSVLTEYRALDEKRLTHGLSPDEQARFARLRELVGTAGGAPGVRPGFDVNAAAAALRESLMPAGLRNRPPPTPAPVEPLPESAEADALASAYEEAPAATAEEAAAAPQDPLFDPASLGAEQPAWDPAAYPADPNAAYDPNAYATDPAAQQPYDPNAYAVDPNAQPYDPSAYPADPNAAYPAEGYAAGAQQAWDPNAYAGDPNAQPYDPNAYAGDPNAQPYDPNAYPADPNAQPYDPSAYPADPNAGDQAEPEERARQAWDANPPADPNAAVEEAGFDPSVEPGYDPNAAALPADAAAAELWDPSAAPEGGAWTAADAGAAPGWDAEPAPPAPTPGAPFGEYDVGPEGGFAEIALAEEPPAEATEPLEADAAAPAPAPELGEYDDTAGFAAEPFAADAVPEAALDPAAAAPELQTTWHADAALDAGFAAESGGSFGAGADAAAPEWAQAPAPPPWEGAPGLELGAPPDAAAADGAEGFEVSPAAAPGASGTTLPAEGGELFDASGGDLAPAEEPDFAAGEAPGPAPELDFSQPELTAPEDVPAEPEPAPPAAAGAPPEIAELPPEDAAASLPPLDLSLEGGAEPPATRTLSDAMLPERELSAPPPEPAVASLDLELPPEPAADAAELPDVIEISEDALVDEAAAADAAPALAPEAPIPDLDLSFDLSEEPPAVEPPAPAAPALAAPEPAVAAPAAASSDEDIPTIDGAEILEEIVEEVPSAPPQPLDFEPLAPAAVAAAVTAPTAVPSSPSIATPAAPAPAPAAPAPTPSETPIPAPAAPCVVAGSHRVVVHTVEGLVRRGLLDDPDLAAAALALAPQPGAPAEDVPTEKVKAIFFMLAPGEKPPAAEGKRVRVTFRDGRQIAGLSPDYTEDGLGFFMIPADTRTNTGRIWVFRSAVRQVSVS